MNKINTKLAIVLAGAFAMRSFASSHMDAPLIVADPPANTTDVYSFVHDVNGVKCLVTALSVYPFEEPGIGPNKYNFDDNVLYEIHVATGNDVSNGLPSVTYQFQFTTHYKATNTILQSYLGVINDIGDSAQNLTQTYTVTKINENAKKKKDQVQFLGSGVVPPNNQGLATPLYNESDNGENRAKGGVATAGELDHYTSQAITNLAGGYLAFAGQRDDGFYGDIQAIFDLLNLRNPGKDSQAGFNIHMMILAIPVTELGGDQQIVGVYATTSRRAVTVHGSKGKVSFGPYVQVGRQGNPLFNEALVAIVDKDLYSRTTPDQDRKLFTKYALTPELAHLLNAIVFQSTVAPETNRTDIANIFIPDLIKTDLSTASVRLAGSGSDGAAPDDSGYSRLSIFGSDTLVSSVQSGFGSGVVPGGWPNGRRFGDDVIDIAVTALSSDLRVLPPIVHGPYGDNVDTNDVSYNKVFPYESTPQNGRNHTHGQ